MKRMRVSGPQVQTNRKRRHRPQPGISLSAMALALVASGLGQKVAAQSYDAQSSVTLGSANITTGTNTTNIAISSESTIIEWIANDSSSGPIQFQAPGTTATFSNATALSDYTVLNRIIENVEGIPISGAVTFEGTTNSLLDHAQGGNIWFYAPSGILTTAGSTFNVGSLVLTTNDIDTTGGLRGPGGEIRFRGAADATSNIFIRQGTSISAAAAAGAYVAIVAPQVQFYGDMDVDGPIGIVAAEQVDMTVSTNLFDIVIAQGTTDASGIRLAGNVGGPSGDNRISIMALPKNDALTMALSGNIGYVPAGTAISDGSSVELLAGFASNVGGPNSPSGTANLQLGTTETVVSSRLDARATGLLSMEPASDQTLDFVRDATFYGGTGVDLIAGAQNNIIGRESLSLNGNLGVGVQDGSAVRVIVDGSSITGIEPGAISVTGDLYVNANPFNDTPHTAADGADMTAGSVEITASYGTIGARNLTVEAIGKGGFGSSSGGDATGGTINVTVANGGTLGALGNVDFDASAYGGNSDNTGGNAVAGAINMNGSGGLFDFVSPTFTVGASAGQGTTNGNATGGQIALTFTQSAQSWSDVDFNANAGEEVTAIIDNVPFTFSGLAREADAGSISIQLSNDASLTVQNDFWALANGFGVTDQPGTLVANGGNINIVASDQSSLTVGREMFVQAGGGVDDLEDPSLITSFDRTPTAFGGTVVVDANGGSINAGYLEAGAQAQGAGAASSAGAVTAGSVTVSARNGGSVTIGGDPESALILDANAYGGSRAFAADAFAGFASLVTEDGTITVEGSTRLSANATPGFFEAAGSEFGFIARGGTVSVVQDRGSMTLADVALSADGNALDIDGELVPEDATIGAEGRGGSASLVILDGNFTADTITITADGRGGTAGEVDIEDIGTTDPHNAGNGQGGSASFSQEDGVADIGSLLLQANGVGGGSSEIAEDGELTAIAGDGFGGRAGFFANGGTTAVGNLDIVANGSGGAGMDRAGNEAGGDGGNGEGGSAGLYVTTDTSSVTIGQILLNATGTGGSGGISYPGLADDGTDTSGSFVSGNGGDGTGGSALFSAIDTSFAFGPMTLTSDGIGGSGADGGNGIGGSSTFDIADSIGFTGAERTIDSVAMDSNGVGGESEAGGALGAGLSGRNSVDVYLGGSGSLIVENDFTAQSWGDVVGSAVGLSLDVAGGVVNLGGDGFFRSYGPVQLISDQDSILVNGLLTIESGSDISGVFAPTALNDLRFDAVGNINIDWVESGGTAQLVSQGTIDIDNLTSGSSVTVSAVDIFIDSPVSIDYLDVSSSNWAFLSSNGDLNVSNADVLNVLDLISTGGDVTLGFVTAGQMEASASNDIIIRDTVNAASTAILVADGLVDIQSSLVSANIFLSSSDISIGTEASLGSLANTQGIFFAASGSGPAMLGGTGNFEGWNLDSGEITRIAANGSLSIVAEDNFQSGDGSGNLILDDFTFDVGGQMGDVGGIVLLGQVGIDVVGNALFSNVNAGTSITMSSPRIDVDATTGSIIMRDPIGTPGGTLALQAELVMVATDAVAEQIDAGISLEETNQLLDQPTGAIGSGGYLQTGNLFVFVEDALFIQNSGEGTDFDARRGFTASFVNIITGSYDGGGQDLTPFAVDPSNGPQISINGRIRRDSDTFIYGIATHDDIIINGVAASTPPDGLDPASAINGCQLGTNCGVVTPPPPPTPTPPPPPPTPTPPPPPPTPTPPPPPPTRPDHDEPTSDGTSQSEIIGPANPVASDTTVQGPAPIVQEVEVGLPGYAPLIDEPVTGVGNEDLWMDDCQDGGSCEQDGETQ